MSVMPQHHLPSYGRVDRYTDGRAPMTITGSSTPPAQQPPPAPTVTEQPYSAVQAVPAAQREYLAELAERDLTPDEHSRDTRAFAAPVLDVAEAGFKQRAAEHDANYQQTLANLTANVDESSAARIRDRAFDRLSHADSPVAAARQIIESAKAEELGVVLEEVPNWLEARGHPTNWVPGVLADTVPEVAAAATKRQKANQARDIGLTTIGQIRRCIDGACPASNLMSADDVRNYDPEVM